MVKGFPMLGLWGVDMRIVEVLLTLSGFGGFFVRRVKKRPPWLFTQMPARMGASR